MLLYYVGEETCDIFDTLTVTEPDANQNEYQLDSLCTVLRRWLQTNNLTINLNKCKLSLPEMIFFGHVFSRKGISPDPIKQLLRQPVLVR